MNIDHNCQPSAVGGFPRPHNVSVDQTWTCPCGKKWRIVHRDWVERSNSPGQRMTCGCGWERIDNDPRDDVTDRFRSHRQEMEAAGASDSAETGRGQ